MHATLAPEKCHIYIIRHAESRSNAGHRTSSPADNPITLKGQAQAQELAQKICNSNITPDLIVISPYLRTKMTATPTMELYPQCQIETWPEIHEFNYLNSTRCANTTQAERRPFVEKYWQDMDPNYSDGGNAESFNDLINRIKQTIEHINSFTDKTILIFSHGQFMAMLKIYLQNPNASINELMQLFKDADRGRTIANCEIIKIY